MKKRCLRITVLLFFFVLAGCACDRRNVSPLDMTPILSEDIVSVTVTGYGKTVQSNDAETVRQLKEIMGQIAFEPAKDPERADAPGAITVTVVLEYQSGSLREITYPYCRWEGNVYMAAESSVQLFDLFFP